MHDEQTLEDVRSQKTHIRETDDLLFDPNALSVFEDSDLVIPISVIEGNKPLKKDLNETGRNARMVSRHLRALRKNGSQADRVPLSRGGFQRARIPSEQASLPGGFSLILKGDPSQIDNPYVDATANGLSHVVERFRELSIAGHITLRKGERSELAERATRLL